MVPSYSLGRDLFNRIYKVTEQFLDVRLNYLGAVLFDKHIPMAIKNQQALLIAYSDCKAAKAFRLMAKMVEEMNFKHGLNGNTSFFLERLIAANNIRNISN